MIYKDPLEDKILSLIGLWDLETSRYSWHKVDHPAYKAVVLLGEKAIPILIKHIDCGWLPVLALGDITGAKPVKKENYGKYSKIKEDWLEWYKNNGVVA